MFKKINEGGVVSDDGFSMQITGPETLECTYNNYLIKITMAYNPQKKVVYIYANEKSKWVLEREVTIPDKEKELIIFNLKQSVKLLKGTFEIS